MICEIARNLSGERLETVEALERDLGLTLVAFTCRELEPDREERLRLIMEQLGPQLQAEPAEPEEAQLQRIREVEEALGLSLVAVRP
jgi:hypothetical protein